jgi:hypothetical protein
MDTNRDFIINLNDVEMRTLTYLSNLISANPGDNEIEFCKESKDTSKLMPERVKNKIKHFVNSGSETGFILFKYDLCEDELPDTPPNNTYHVGETTRLAKIQSMFMNYSSDMVAYQAEGYGCLFQDVIPVKKMETEQTSISSKTVLELHTEQAFSNLKPDILSLACLRGNQEAYTYILPVKTILSFLSSEEIETLYKPLWMIGVDLSFKLNGVEFVEGEIRGPLSILNGRKDDPTLIFDQDLMKGVTEEANVLLKKIVDIYHKSKIGHNLQQGEIVMIDNRRATHGRSSFTPLYNGKDRFLVRCFGTTDLKKSEYAREKKNRTILAKYS